MKVDLKIIAVMKNDYATKYYYAKINGVVAVSGLDRQALGRHLEWELGIDCKECGFPQLCDMEMDQENWKK